MRRALARRQKHPSDEQLHQMMIGRRDLTAVTDDETLLARTFSSILMKCLASGNGLMVQLPSSHRWIADGVRQGC